jgi:hypothetical protein
LAVAALAAGLHFSAVGFVEGDSAVADGNAAFAVALGGVDTAEIVASAAVDGFAVRLPAFVVFGFAVFAVAVTDVDVFAVAAVHDVDAVFVFVDVAVYAVVFGVAVVDACGCELVADAFVVAHLAGGTEL